MLYRSYIFNVPAALRLTTVLINILLIAACSNNNEKKILNQELQTKATDNSGSMPIGSSDRVAPQNKFLQMSIYIVNQARDTDFLISAASAASDLFKKCHITLKTNIHHAQLTPNLLINRQTREQLVNQYGQHKPTLFVVTETAEYDVAYSYLPSPPDSLAASSWITKRVSNKCFVWILMHELGHVLLNSAKHTPGTDNIMSTGCKQNNWGSSSITPKWTAEQCTDLRRSKFFSS